ncbi:MAG: class I SAM-dependent methyltransferase [Acidimicrobiia bacterium]|nr:class I SAM-dependent methyltransferase [Acidimicrobiia bacterium]
MESDTPRTLTFQPSGFTAVVSGDAQARADEYASEMMDDGELRYLAGVALAFPWSPGELVVEIGSYSGMTAAFVAETLAEAGLHNRILSIDPFERVPHTRRNPGGKYKRYLRTMEERGLEHRCLPLVAYSQDAASAVPDHIGLLIIDGNHEYDSVAGDLARYAPKVLPGGFIFLDDHTATYPGVVKAVEEFVDATPDYEPLHQSYFAILQRRR